MENNKDIGWYLDVDYACDAFSFFMDAMLALSCCFLLALSCCLFVYLNVALQLPSVLEDRCVFHVTYFNLS